MPNEYEKLVEALKDSGIPFAEHGWKSAPAAPYGVIALDAESDDFGGDDSKLDRAYEASIDVFIRLLKDRKPVTETVENILTDICGSAWERSYTDYETNTGLLHLEWTCEVLDTGEEDGD